MSELMCSQSKCRRKDEHIAELKAELAALRKDAQNVVNCFSIKGRERLYGIHLLEQVDKLAALLQEKGE